MKGTWTIYRRELAGLFVAPLAWLLLFLALLGNGFLFTYILQATGGEVNETLNLVLGGTQVFWILMMVLPPLITMRMISEEARSGMLEFLMTAPVSDAGIVVGKALAATTFLVAMWSSALVYAFAMSGFGVHLDWGQHLSTFAGVVLLSGLLSSLGVLASSMSATPVLAAFIGMMLNFALIYGLQLAYQLKAFSPQKLEAFLSKVDVLAIFQQSFFRGALDSAHFVFFLAWTAAALFVAVRMVEMRRWR